MVLGEFTDAYQTYERFKCKIYAELFVCGQYATLCNFAMESAIRTGDALYPSLGWIILNLGDRDIIYTINVYYDGKKLFFMNPKLLMDFLLEK